jgi:hypothetical protein
LFYFFYLYGNLDTTCANTDVNWLKFLPEHVNANNTCCLSPPDAEPYFNIAEYLSERGFVVLKYDKRGVGPNDTILDSNVWGNVTISDLKQDAEKALGNSRNFAYL